MTGIRHAAAAVVATRAAAIAATGVAVVVVTVVGAGAEVAAAAGWDAAGASSAVASPATLSPETAQAAGARPEIDAIFAEWDVPGSPGCALGVVQDGEFVYRRGYGFAQLDWDIPIATDTVFYVGSVSKQFTAAAIALLVQDGALALDDDIRRYFPEMPSYERVITVRHLVHHTSGLRDIYTLMALAGIRLEDVFPDEEAIALIAAQRETNFAPGDEYLYSNSGYFLLAQLVERVSGKTLREFADERIFSPLGMRDTHFHDRPGHVVARRAISYQPRRSGAPPGDGAYEVSYLGNFDKVGAGGLYSTVDDLLLWDRNFYTGDVGGEAFLEMMRTRGVLHDGEQLTYAFGLDINEYRGLDTLGHGGSMMGFKAAFLQFPSQRFSVIATCNLGPIDPTALARRVADVYLAEDLGPAPGDRVGTGGLEPRPGAEVFDGRELADFAGSYYSDELAVTYELTAREGGLWLRLRNTPELALRRTGDDEARARGWRLAFVRGPGGRVDGFTVDAGRVTNIRFARR